MNVYRLMAMAVMACAAGLSATACTAGITTASRVAPPSPATSRTASSPAASDSHSPSPSPAATIRVHAPIGSFPVPGGAQVVFNMTCPKQINLALTPVTPSQAEAFYLTALPKAGYKATQNMSFGSAGDPKGLAEIGFTGHGYTGQISDIADLSADASAAPSLGNIGGTMTKNVLEIMMSPPGVPDSYNCPGF